MHAQSVETRSFPHTKGQANTQYVPNVDLRHLVGICGNSPFTQLVMLTSDIQYGSVGIPHLDSW